MHEIGHALGLGYTNEENHLMCSTESPEISYDVKGYLLPERLEEFYVGQNLLLFNENELKSQIHSLDVRISREESQYDEYYKQYQYYEGKTLSQKEYAKAEKAYTLLTSQGEKINALITEQNDLIDQIN